MPKKLLIIVAIVIVAIIALVFLLGGGKYSSPQKTLNQAVKAMKNGDVDAYFDCFTKKSQELLGGEEQFKKIVTPELLKIAYDDYEDTKFELEDKTDDTAVMVGEDGEKFFFKKEDGKWKINIAEFGDYYETE